MNFKELYKNTSEQIQQTFVRMWNEYAPNMVEAYRYQLENILKDNVSGNIVVEDMSQWESADNNEEWKKIVNPLIWRKWKKNARKNDDEDIEDIKYPPYKHQYNSWKTLLQENKSIVVTSGTGSGKTECFMIPLIQDLGFNQQPDREKGVEAIFLYPLNALMEDQRERMSDYIRFSGSDIKFAVFNGHTPESITPVGLYHNEIGNRRDIRDQKPNILFTNPSMLEYMLLRENDRCLFTKNLKWIVIDEAHTYSGSAGAELALLLRRVLLACGKNPDDIKFATSSATIGNDDDQLKQFIADITGQKTSNIEIVKGRRTMPKSLSEDKSELLHADNFVLLDRLFPEGSVEDKLEELDRLTDKELKVRLHYFVKTLTTGLYIDPTKDLTPQNKFNLLTNIPLVDGKLDSHPLNAHYCSKCGSILGYGVQENNCYTRDIKELSTLEDDLYLDDDNDDDASISASSQTSDTNKFFIGIASDSSVGTRTDIIDGNRLNDNSNGKFVYSKIKQNDVRECPCCGSKGVLHSFHMSADFIGRLIAPILLQQITPHENAQNDKKLPTKGCKYITFADSRQSAAGPTLKQNLETEEVWVTGVIYKKLMELHKSRSVTIKKLKKDIDSYKDDPDLVDEYKKAKNELVVVESREINLTWQKALDALLSDDNCEAMCLAFATNDKDESIEQLKRKYVLSALYRIMNKRPANGKNSPENLGLIHTYYPDIEILNERDIPDAVKNFNNLISEEDNKIGKKDWHDFIKTFIDCEIRSNQSMFFKMYREENGRPVDNVNDWKEIDIEDIRNYRTEEGRRRSIRSPKLSEKGRSNRYVMLLCRLLGKDSVNGLSSDEKEAIKDVLNCLWLSLRELCIAEMSYKISWSWNNQEKRYEKWRESDDNYMNLTRIAFKLYEENVKFDDHLKIPLDTAFKGYSPYPNKDGKYNVKCVDKNWTRLSSADKDWFNENRSDIAHRWTVKLERILKYICSEENTLYIQAEHTAQVARSVIKDKTKKFKDGKLNIMACSTTMEMGVDLGDLELVVMNNVPPQPANYKQRAGRAGRGSQNKSASVTLCSGDSIGKTLLENPLEGFIKRLVMPPKIDLVRASHQLILRHINSMLLRNFVSISTGRNAEDDRGMRICDFFTGYSLESAANGVRRYIRVIKVGDTSTIFPSEYEDLLNDDVHKGSLYRQFLNKLDGWCNGTDEQSEYVRECIKSLIKHTSMAGYNVIDLILLAKSSIMSIAKNIHEELFAIKKMWRTDYINTDQKPTGNGVMLYWQFANVLNTNLLTYLSNHQFTPNANMPVNIVEMILEENRSFWDKTENPTRDLRTALSEYAPGRLVFLDGRTYRMGGVKWNTNKPTQSIRHCRNGHTWISVTNECPICGEKSCQWEHFGESIKMMTPLGYYPSSDVSRITKKEAMNVELGVELIGVGPWDDNKSHRLYACRTNKDIYNSHILYYDKGVGYGYHICKECGYAVPAPSKWDGKEDGLIDLMYDITQDKNDREYYRHNYRYECKMDEDNPCGNVLTNIVLGGSIQTDYCEIALYDNTPQLSPMETNDGNKKIANTLGVLLCSGLSQKVGFDRGELDFVVRAQNGQVSLCVFDVAKGGSGRARLLPELISELLDNARTLLNRDCDSIEQILDRNSMRYAEYIDIDGTKNWLKNEFDNRTYIPEGLPSGSRNSSYIEIVNAVQQTSDANNVYLFVNNEFAKWNYDGNGISGSPCWKNCREDMRPRGTNKYNLVVIGAPNVVPAEDSIVLSILKDSMNIKSVTWNNEVYKPLARVGDMLYITNTDDYTMLDEKWASDCVWKCKCDGIDISDWNYHIDTSSMECIEIPLNTSTTTKSFIDKLCGNPLKTFLNSAKGCNLTVEYSDRYLCTQLGMINLHQLVMGIVERMECKEYSITYNICTENIDGKDADDKYRRLTDYIDGYCLEGYMNNLLNPEGDDSIQINGCRYRDLNHDRTLKIKSDEGHTLIIRPDGGFGRGWTLDTQNTNGQWYDNNCTIDADIPIISRPTDNRYIYYVIYKTKQ